MCGRITQKSNPNKLGLGLTTVTLIEPLEIPPRYNGSPGQEHWVIRRNPKTGEYQHDRLTWGLIPYWVTLENSGRKPINAKAETVASLPSFRDAYKRRRCILPIDNFFEWRAIKGAKVKQPYAIAMKSGEHGEYHHLADSPGIKPEPPRRRPFAQPLDLNRVSNLRIELHLLHPPPSAECGTGLPTAGILLRRNRPTRLLH